MPVLCARCGVDLTSDTTCARSPDGEWTCYQCYLSEEAPREPATTPTCAVCRAPADHCTLCDRYVCGPCRAPAPWESARCGCGLRSEQPLDPPAEDGEAALAALRELPPAQRVAVLTLDQKERDRALREALEALRQQGEASWRDLGAESEAVPEPVEPERAGPIARRDKEAGQ